MRKVIIADDEMIIREGLRESIYWEKLDLELIDCAKNGLELLEIAKKQTPDICLIDICMPKINGLELISKLKDISEDIICIIVSGHDEFDYAQKAIKLNVFDYILKPVKEKRLNECLKKATCFLCEKDEARKQYERTNKILEKNMDLLMDRFLLSLVQGKYTDEEIQQSMDFLCVDFGKNPVVAVVSLDKNLDVQSNERESIVQKYIVKEFLRTELKKFFEYAYVAIDEIENVFFIINVEKHDDWKNKIAGIEHRLNILVKADINYERVSAGVCDIHYFYEDIRKKMNTVYSEIVAKTMEKIKNGYGECGLSFSEIADELGVSISYLSKQFKKEIGCTFVEYLTKVRIKKAIELLESTDLRIVEISEKVGYTSQHYFSVVFKKLMGVSPNHYLEK